MENCQRKTKSLFFDYHNDTWKEYYKYYGDKKIKYIINDT
jgi:hypothetical protein